MYCFEQLLRPIWATDTIYEESFTMVENRGLPEAPLLFVPQEVLSVTSADHTAEYSEGKDWIIRDDVFCLTPESRIFRFRQDELLFQKEKPGACFATKDGRYSLFREGHFFHDRQICITYKKKTGEFEFSPELCIDRLPKTIDKLSHKKNIKIVLFGDSIAAGANSSGLTLTTPFLPSWGSLFAENLRRHYETSVQFINTSLGGMASKWGMDNAEELVGKHTPDLAIIAFGMNDRMTGEKFAENIRIIRDTVKQMSPETEFILCATTVPNKILEGFYAYQSDYKKALEGLLEQGTAVADFYGMQKCLLKRKRFVDLTGNNVNHPNDFMIRCHAQVLSEMLIERK